MITSPYNEGLKNLKKLINNASARLDERLYTVEGPKLFCEAPEGLIERVYISEGLEAQHIASKLSGHSPITVRSDIFNKLTDTRTPQGIITVMRMPAYRLADLRGSGIPFIIALETIQDPGNLGTIIRTAEAAGATGILMSGDCADPFGPKAARASAGSIFRMPVVQSPDILGAVSELRESGIRTYAAHLKGDRPHTGFDYRGPVIFLIGNEGRGLSDGLADLADHYIRIPMEGGVESLNASLAAAVMMYEAHRQRAGE